MSQIRGSLRKKSGKSEKQCFAIKKNSQEVEFECHDPKNRKATDDKEKPDIKIETISFTPKRKNRHQEIRFHAVIWSGLTTPFKRKLCSDIHGLREDARERLGCKQNQKYRHFRSIVNSMIKGDTINSGFSDVVIYFGENGKRIRGAFRSSIRQILSDQNDKTNASLVIITSSLASYILTESLSETKKAVTDAKQARSRAKQADAAAKQADAVAREAAVSAEQATAAAKEADAVAKQAAASAAEAKTVAKEANAAAKQADAVAREAAVSAEQATAAAKEADAIAAKARAAADKARVEAEEAKDGAEGTEEIEKEAAAKEAGTRAKEAHAVAKQVDAVAREAAVSAEQARAAADEADAVAEQADAVARKAEKRATKLSTQVDPLGNRLSSMAANQIPLSIFMAANQIPLLELAQTADFSAFENLEHLMRKNGDDNLKKEDNDLNIEVVAFTDPNDLLSYKIEELKNASVTNVIINNTWDFGVVEGLEGLFEGEGPFISAHTGYLENETVWALILCGRPKSSEGRSLIVKFITPGSGKGNSTSDKFPKPKEPVPYCQQRN